MEPDRKRPKRNPLSGEEVANIIAFKKKRELVQIQKFKRTPEYRFQNIFNIACFFLYVELLFCFFGPCNYMTHYARMVSPKYAGETAINGLPMISDLNLICVNDNNFNFIIEDGIEIPHRFTTFEVGTDFILKKSLKGTLEGSDKTYRLFSASPVLLLSLLVLVISTGAFIYNLNENAYSLMALTVLNALVLSGILVF